MFGSTLELQPNIAYSTLLYSANLLIKILAKNLFSEKSYSTIIYSGLADGGLWPTKNLKGQVKGQLSIELWYLARTLDPLGAGNVEIDLSKAAELLEISIYSVRRRINWGLSLGLLRAAIPAGAGRKKIYYASLTNVCSKLGIEDLGACIDADISDIKNIKFLAAEGEALKLQNQSRWREDRKRQKKRLKPNVEPDKLTSSELCYGAILFKRGNLTFLKRSFSAYGGSQKRIGWEMGRHPSTVQRRLSDSYRAEHGVNAIAKTQLAVAPEIQRQFVEGNSSPIKKLIPGQRIISISGLGKFRLATNVYASKLDIQAKRAVRARVKRACKLDEIASEWRNDWKLDPEYQAWKAAMKAREIDKSELCSENFGRLGKEGKCPSVLLINENRLEEGVAVKMV